MVPAHDSPRREDRFVYHVDSYFHSIRYVEQERDLDPVLGLGIT